MVISLLKANDKNKPFDLELMPHKTPNSKDKPIDLENTNNEEKPIVLE